MLHHASNFPSPSYYTNELRSIYAVHIGPNGPLTQNSAHTNATPQANTDDQRRHQDERIAMNKKTLVANAYAVDGLNVCFSFHREQPLNLTALLTLLYEIRKRGDDFVCFFDATAPHLIRQKLGCAEETVYRSLFTCPGCPFFQVPAGSRADDYLLSYADKNQCSVVSNDRFQDYVKTFPWLAENPTRRVTGLVVRDCLTVPALNIYTPLCHNPSVASQKLLHFQKFETRSKGRTQNTKFNRQFPHKEGLTANPQKRLPLTRNSPSSWPKDKGTSRDEPINCPHCSARLLKTLLKHHVSKEHPDMKPASNAARRRRSYW